MFLNKNKKTKLIFISFLIFLILSSVMAIYFLSRNNLKKVKIATALPHIKELLQSPDIKEDLKKQGYDLKIVYPSDFAQNNKTLLKNDKVIATLDSHLPFVRFLNQDESSFQFVVAQPVYWAHIGLYNFKKEQNINTPHKIHDWNRFMSFKDEANRENPIKILICNENHQMNIGLRLLEKCEIIKRKSGHEDTNENMKSKCFSLTQDDFEIPDNIQICKSNDPSPSALKSMVNEFRNGGYDLFINYPAIAGVKNGTIDIIKTLEKPDQNDYNIAYTISLITKKENEKNDFIIKLKEILQKDKLIEALQSKITGSVIPKDQTENIAKFINSKFS